MLNVSQIAQCSTSHCKWHRKDEEGLENTACCMLEKELQANRSGLLKVTALIHAAFKHIYKSCSLSGMFSLKMDKQQLNHVSFARIYPRTFHLSPPLTVWLVVDTNVIVCCVLCLSEFHRLAGHTQTNLCFSFTGHPILPLQILNLFYIPLGWRLRETEGGKGGISLALHLRETNSESSAVTSFSFSSRKFNQR